MGIKKRLSCWRIRRDNVHCYPFPLGFMSHCTFQYAIFWGVQVGISNVLLLAALTEHPWGNRNWDFMRSGTALAMSLISPDPGWWNSRLASDVFSWREEDKQTALRLHESKSRAIWRCWGGRNKVPISDHKDIRPKDVTSEQKKSLQGHTAEEHSRRKERCVQVQGSMKCHCMLREQQAVQR